jgi:hypothetical protein
LRLLADVGQVRSGQRVVDDERGLADDIAEGLRDQGLAVDAVYDGLDAAARIDLTPTT